MVLVNGDLYNGLLPDDQTLVIYAMGDRVLSNLSAAQLDRSGATLLYQQVYALLKGKIADGSWAIGDVLPSEKELAESLGISSFTCKRAFDSLATDGLIDRGRGKKTRVTSQQALAPPLPTHLFGGALNGLIESVLAEAWNVEIEILDFCYMPAPLAVSEALGMGAHNVVQRTTNVGRRHGQLSGLVTSYLPEEIGRTFTQRDLTSTPRFVLLLRAGVQIGRAEQVLSARPANDEVATALEVEPGTSLLVLRRTVFDQTGQGVEHIEALFPWDRFEYRMSLTS